MCRDRRSSGPHPARGTRADLRHVTVDALTPARPPRSPAGTPLASNSAPTNRLVAADPILERKSPPVSTKPQLQPKWYSPAEVAVLLGYGLSKVKTKMATGELRSVKDG